MYMYNADYMTFVSDFKHVYNEIEVMFSQLFKQYYNDAFKTNSLNTKLQPFICIYSKHTIGIVFLKRTML